MDHPYFIDISFSCKAYEEEIVFSFIENKVGVNPHIVSYPSKELSEVHLYTHEKDFQKTLLKLEAIRPFLEEGDNIVFLKASIQEADWKNEWKKHFNPIIIGEKIQITPAWQKANPTLMNLFLEPKMGFGTGQHASTFLCLKALIEHPVEGKRILDVGAGSGILGVAALLLKASHCDFIEIDPDALDACFDTVERNGVKSKSTLYRADIMNGGEWERQSYDLCFMNIIAEVICPILALPFLRSIKTLILSGILQERRDVVLKSLKDNNFKVQKETKKQDWLCLVVKPC
jgi:ribosomal protein L11 methyltransferase